MTKEEWGRQARDEGRETTSTKVGARPKTHETIEDAHIIGPVCFDLLPPPLLPLIRLLYKYVGSFILTGRLPRILGRKGEKGGGGGGKLREWRSETRITEGKEGQKCMKQPAMRRWCPLIPTTKKRARLALLWATQNGSACPRIGN